MAFKTITVVCLRINGEPTPFLDNTFMFSQGLGEIITKTVVYCGGTQAAYVFNKENARSTIKFSVIPSFDLIEKIEEWFNQPGENVISADCLEGGIANTLIFTGAALITSPDHNINSDISVELEWAADPMMNP